MLHNTKNITGMSIEATDGSIGHVEDVLFHDEFWTVSHIVIDTGPWIFGRQLLCGPEYLQDVDEAAHSLRVGLTKAQIKESPDLDTDLPVSEIKRREFNKYQKGPVFWSGSGVRKESFPPGAMPAIDEEPEREKQRLEREVYAKHLRSAGEVVGYRVEADDTELGRVDGVLVDDETWAVRYFAVTVAGAEPPRLQIYSPDWVETVRWIERSVHLKLAHEVAANAPPLSADAMVSRDYEQKLYDYYELEAR